MKIIRPWLTLTLLFFLSFPVFAGKLDDFEADATKQRESSSERKKEKDNGNSYSSSEEDDDCGGLAECLIGALIEGFFRALFSSLTNSGEPVESRQPVIIDHDKVEPAEPVQTAQAETEWTRQKQFKIDKSQSESYARYDTFKPEMRLGVRTQRVSSTIDGTGFDLNFVARSFMFGFDLIRYREAQPEDQLDVAHGNFALRVPINNATYLGLGMGLYNLRGEKSTFGWAFYTPLTVRPTQYFSLEFAPSLINFNGTSVLDVDMSANIKWKHLGLRGGMRILKSPLQDIQGPYIGMTANF